VVRLRVVEACPTVADVQGSISVPILLIAVAYVLGTFPSAILVARANGIDIRTVGSGNPGASNVTRALGWRKGAWVYVLDALKGAAATGIALGLDGRPLAYWAGAAAIIGHMFPVFRRFRGGKGVATGSGVLFVLHPIIAPFACALWWVVSRLTGKAAVGSLVAVGLVPAGLALLDRPAWEYGALGALCALILVKHWRNFMRLLRRQEPSLSSVEKVA
jgi:glycerol-3-phosphate acyltransferase PlsY